MPSFSQFRRLPSSSRRSAADPWQRSAADMNARVQAQREYENPQITRSYQQDQARQEKAGITEMLRQKREAAKEAAAKAKAEEKAAKDAQKAAVDTAKASAKEAEEKRKTENARAADDLTRQGREFTISRETGAPIVKQSDADWARMRDEKVKTARVKAAAKPFEDELKRVKVELDNPDLPRVTKQEKQDAQEATDRASAVLKQKRAANAEVYQDASDLTDDEVAAAYADPAKRKDAQAYMDAKKHADGLPEREAKRTALEKRAYELEKRILDPEQASKDLETEVKAEPTEALSLRANEIEARAMARGADIEKNKARIEARDTEMNTRVVEAERRIAEAQTQGVTGDVLADLHTTHRAAVEEQAVWQGASEDQRLELAAQVDEVNRDVKDLETVSKEANKRAEADRDRQIDALDTVLPGAGARMRALQEDAQKRGDELRRKYSGTPDTPEAQAARQAFETDIKGKTEAIVREARLAQTERQDNLRAARVSIERDGFGPESKDGMEGSMQRSGLDPRRPEHRAAYYDANTLMNLEQGDTADLEPGQKPPQGYGSATLSDGSVHVMPKYVTDAKEYASIVEASDGTPEAKAKAMADLPRLQRAQAEALLPVLKQAGTTKAAKWIPGIPSLQKWQSEGEREGDEVSQVQQYLAEMRQRGLLSKIWDNVVRSGLAGLSDIATQAAGVGGLLGSETLGQAASDLSKQTEAFTAPISAEGGADSITSAILGQTARMAGPMAATILVTRGLGAGIGTAAALSAGQTAGNQYAETYGELREQGKSHGEAWKAVAPYALASGLVTAVLTKAGGTTGLEAALGTKGGKEAAKGFWRNAITAVPKQALAEIPEELPDELFSQISTALAKDPNANVTQVIGDFWRNSPELIGAIALMGGVGGVSEARQAGRQALDQPPAEDLDTPEIDTTQQPEGRAAIQAAVDSWQPDTTRFPASLQDTLKAMHGKEPPAEAVADVGRTAANALVDIAAGADPRGMSPEVRRVLGIKINPETGAIEPLSKSVMPMVESVADAKGKHQPVITDAARAWLTQNVPAAGEAVKLSYGERVAQVTQPLKKQRAAKKAVAPAAAGETLTTPEAATPSQELPGEPSPAVVESGTPAAASEGSRPSEAAGTGGGTMTGNTDANTGAIEAPSASTERNSEVGKTAAGTLAEVPGSEPGSSPKLPANLSKASPRYSYGAKQFTLEFESDLDRAAYIAAQDTPSKSDAQFVKFVADNTGLAEADIRKRGKDIRAYIKGRAAQEPAGHLVIPGSSLWKSEKVKLEAQSKENPESPDVPRGTPVTGGDHLQRATAEADAVIRETPAGPEKGAAIAAKAAILGQIRRYNGKLPIVVDKTSDNRAAELRPNNEIAVDVEYMMRRAAELGDAKAAARYVVTIFRHEIIHLHTLATMNVAQIQGLFRRLPQEMQEETLRLYNINRENYGAPPVAMNDFQKGGEFIRALVEADVVNYLTEQTMATSLKQELLQFLADFLQALKNLAKSIKDPAVRKDVEAVRDRVTASYLALEKRIDEELAAAQPEPDMSEGVQRNREVIAEAAAKAKGQKKDISKPVAKMLSPTPAEESTPSDREATVERIASIIVESINERVVRSTAYQQAADDQKDKYLHAVSDHLKHADKLLSLIENKDAAELERLNHSGNKGSWKAFEAVTGIPVGATDKSRTQAIRQLVGDAAYDEAMQKRDALRQEQNAADAAETEKRRFESLRQDAARQSMKSSGMDGASWVESLLKDGWRVENIAAGKVPTYGFVRGGEQMKHQRGNAGWAALVAYGRALQNKTPATVDQTAAGGSGIPAEPARGSIPAVAATDSRKNDNPSSDEATNRGSPKAMPPGFKRGDRVKWTGNKGEELTGTIRSVSTERGNADIDTDQIMKAGGVPIGRIEVVQLTRLAPLAPTVKESLTPPPTSDAGDDALREAFGGLFAPPDASPAFNDPLPPDRMEAMMKAARVLVDLKLATPQELAASFDRLAPNGALRRYSAAFWNLLRAFNTNLPAVDDWQAFYAPASAKQTQEAVEAELTAAAHKTVSDMEKQGRSPQDIYAAMVELYDQQPVLNEKTSTSKINQAYSTPAPMAYVLSRLAELHTGRVVAEPSAGNGMLLIDRQPGQTILANEIDPARRARLAAQGIPSTGEDATTWTPAQAPDRVVANPPFGQVMQEGGANKVYQTPMGDTTSIDQAIVLQSLATMAPDGRAAFIIGGPPPTVRTPEARAAYYRKGKAAKFFSYLHKNYKVVDYFTASGDLYQKQGAGWPLDILVIENGRSSIALPGLQAPRMINSWEELSNELDRTDDQRASLNALDQAAMRGRVDEMGARLEQLGGSLSPASNPKPSPARGEESTGRPGATERGPTRGAIDAIGDGPVSGRPATNEGRPLADGPAAQSKPESGPGGERQLQSGEVDASEFQRSFPPASGVNPAGLLAPVNLVGPMTEALDRLKEKVGDLTVYVKGKLGYPAKTDISKYFFGDQIDAIAQAIHTAENGGALVIGDQTGTGKGRIAAGLIKYAIKQGVIPVFVTKNQDLYDAMLDDLVDIGAGEAIPVITNESIAEPELRKRLSKMGAFNGQEVFTEISNAGGLPKGTNVVFTTYDQIKADDAAGITKRERAQAKRGMTAPADRWRMAALRKIAPNAMFILDESHLAGGQSTTGWRLAELLTKAKHAYYSSATFAKRPDNMGIYFRTNLGQVGGDIKSLMELMQAGGVPAMQIGSSMLAQDGQYMRRERSYDGVSFQTHINQDTYERDKELADNYTTGLRAIILVQERMARAAEAVNLILSSFGQSANIPRGNVARLESSNFSAKLHNLVRQYLLAIKANSAARLAVNAIKTGITASNGKVKPHKVIVAVENTMESIIEELQANGYPLNFNGVLQLYLNQMRRIKIGGGSYGREAQYFVVEDTAPEKFKDWDDKRLSANVIAYGTNADGETTADVNTEVSNEMVRRAMAGVFREAALALEDISLADMPVSPIDAMRQAVEREGIRTGEMTGRITGIDADGEIYHRSQQEVKAKLQAKDAFNNEDLDFLVINKSGSTGVSMHASAKFKDQRPRLMIVVQPNLDINELMQTLGRIHRAGQVELPSYINLQTALPAENRPAAIVGRKMAMLNANTTSNADSELSSKESVDILNQYGDEVIHSYLSKHPMLVRTIAQSWEKLTGETGGLKPLGDFQNGENGGEYGYLARSVTGHLAILPVEEQEAFWEAVTADYRGLIAYLDAMGKNALRASVLDMKAETVDSDIFTPGGEDSESVFSNPSFMEVVNAELGKEPLSVDAAISAANKAIRGAEVTQDQFTATSNEFIEREDKRKAEVSKNWDERRQDWINAQRDQRDTIAYALGQVGQFGTYERDDGTQGFAFVENVDLDEKRINTPSAHHAVVRVNDSQDRLRLPLSQFSAFFTPAGFSSTSRDRLAREGWERSWTFGTQQAMVTGNLLAALRALEGRGRVVNYTKKDGSQQMGILLGEAAAARMESKNAGAVTINTADDLAEALKNKRVVRNRDGSVIFVSDGDETLLKVPAARQTGGKYWRDPTLNRLMSGGEFVQRGNVMVGKVSPSDLASVLAYFKSAHNDGFSYTIGKADSLGAPPQATKAEVTAAIKAIEATGAFKWNAKTKTFEEVEQDVLAAPPDEILNDWADAANTANAKDVEYLAAVEAGDMAAAQKMVDQAAKEAGYAKKLYHGTTETETKDGVWTSSPAAEQAAQKLKDMAARFGLKDWYGITSLYDRLAKSNQLGITQEDAANAKKWQNALIAKSYTPARKKLAFDAFKLPSGEQELGVHLGNRDAAEMFGEVFPFWTNLGKSIRLPDLGTWNYQSVMRELRKRGVAITEDQYTDVFNARDNNAALRDLLSASGIDSIVYKNEAEGRGDSYIALRPEQIKSADPVTYSNGKVVPLSERFDDSKDSILFAPPDAAYESPRANQGDTPENRDSFAKAREIYVQRDLTKADFADIRQKVAGWVTQNEDGALDIVQYKMQAGEELSLEEEFARRLLANRIRTRGVRDNDGAAIALADALWAADIAEASETARKLAARVDQVETPQERLDSAIGRILAPQRSKMRERMVNTWTTSAKRREIARLEMELAEAKTEAARARLRAELAEAKARQDQDEVLADIARQNNDAVDKALKRIGLTQADLTLMPDDRYAMQTAILEMPGVKAVLAGLGAMQRKAVEMSVRGYADDAIVRDTELSAAQVERLTEHFRSVIAKQAVAESVKRGKQTFSSLISAGKNLIKWVLEAPPMPLRNMVAQGVPGASAVDAQINAILNAAIPTRRQRNARALHAVKVTSKKGTKITVFVPYDPSDWRQVYRAARELSTRNSTVFDKAFEYWINGILSGPQTHVVNTASNLLSTLWHYGPHWLTSAAVNTVVQADEGQRLGELPHLWKGFIKGITPALKNFALAWSTEADPVSSQYLNEPISAIFQNAMPEKLGGGKPAAIGGTLGRVVRVPGRFLVAADAFAKTLIAHGEAAAFAYRSGKAQDLKGVALENYIASQIATYGSESWQHAVATATELTFQDENEVTKAVEGFTNAAKRIKVVGLLMKFLLPFVRTPTNIYKTGLRKAGGSIPMMLYRLGKAGFYKIKNGKPVFDSYKDARMVRDISESLMAVVLWHAMMALSEGDADNEDKDIEFTGSRPFGLATSGERASQMRQEGGSNLVVIRRDPVTGKKLDTPIRIAYGRYEPMALTVGTLVDAAREFKEWRRLPSGQQNADRLAGSILAHIGAQAQDKTFLQGISSVARFMEDLSSNRLSVGDAAAKQFFNGIVPNLIRQPLRLSGEHILDSKKAEPVMGSTALGAAMAQGGPKINEAGRPAARVGPAALNVLVPGTTKPSKELFDAALKDWNTRNPGEQWHPDPISPHEWYIYDPAQTGRSKGKIPLTSPKQGTLFESMVGIQFAKKAADALSRLGYQRGTRVTEDQLKAIKKAREDAVTYARSFPPSTFTVKTKP